MDPVRASVTSEVARQTVIVGASGSAWPFVPRKHPGAFFFDFDPQQSVIVWCSGNSVEVLGVTEAACTPHGAFLLAHLHTADRYRIETALSTAFSSLQPFVATYRWLRPDSNETRVLHCRGMLDSESRLFRGFIIDLSSEVVALQNSSDVLASISFAFDQLQRRGIIIDSELRIKSIHGTLDENALSFGLGLVNCSIIRPGALLAAAFLEETPREHLRDILTDTLSNGSCTRAWGNLLAEFTCIFFDQVPQGVAISISDNTQQLRLEQTQKEVLSLSGALAQQTTVITKLLDLEQEIVGFSALISRSSANNPLIRHVSDALVSTAKEAAQHANELMRMCQLSVKSAVAEGVTAPTQLLAPASLTRNYVRHIDALIASNTLRSAQTLAALLRDAGLGCLSTRLSEPELKESFQTHPQLRVAILDFTGDLQLDAPLVRRIRRFFPATNLVGLIHEGTGNAEKLRRAGVSTILYKPVTPKELERAVKSLS